MSATEPSLTAPCAPNLAGYFLRAAAFRYAGLAVPPEQPFRITVIQDALAVTVAAPSTERSGVGDSADRALTADSEPSGPRGPSILPSSGATVGGLYKLVRLLGQGMFGKVYVAQRLDVPEHQVALKLLPRSLYASRNVERELVMLATVGHPNVVQLKDHGMTADYVWLTMPVYEGETLAERLERGAIGMREAYDIFVPVARGLEALHTAGLRHQDVKPENIFLARFNGRVHPVLLDLGVAAEREATFCAGTALYAAPEQVRALNAYPGAVPLSEKMDTYCLASTLLVSLVGPDRFPGETAGSRTELVAAQETRAERPLADDALPDLDGRPRALLQEALQKWLAIEPDERPSMTEVAEQLDVLLEPEREAARAEEALRARQKASLLRFRIAVGALLLAAIAGALVVFSKRETLRLAQELDEVRREGAESFDKLDSCVATYRVTDEALSSCRVAREKDRIEFKQSMEAIAKGAGSEAEHAREMQSMQNLFSSRLKTCEEDAADAAQRHLEEREQLLAAAAQERAALTDERDTQRALAEQRAGEIATLTEEKSTCDVERATCAIERDRCVAASVYSTAPAVASSGSAGPAAPPPRPTATAAPPASTAPRPPAPPPASASAPMGPPLPPSPPSPPGPTPPGEEGAYDAP